MGQKNNKGAEQAVTKVLAASDLSMRHHTI